MSHLEIEKKIFKICCVWKNKIVGRFLSGSHLVSKDEWSFIPFAAPDKYRTSWTENPSNRPLQVEGMYPFSILCMLVFILLPIEHLSVYRWIQQSCRIKQRTATFLLWGMQRWRGAARTLHMGWRSGRGHSETLSWATCAEVVKCARGVLHSVSLAVSISRGVKGQEDLLVSLIQQHPADINLSDFVLPGREAKSLTLCFFQYAWLLEWCLSQTITGTHSYAKCLSSAGRSHVSV